MIKWHNLAPAFLFLSVALLQTSSLQAQFTCTGSICDYFPGGISQELNSTLGKLENDYLQEVLKNNTEASFLTNIISSSVGTGKVRRVQFGVSASAAAVKKDDIIIADNNIELPKLPNGGISLNPAINLDFNLGWVLGQKEDSFLRRFSIYLHGMKFNFNEGDAKGSTQAKNNVTLNGKIESYGGMIRFQAIEETEFGFGFLTWNGLNVGAGYHYARQDYALNYRNDNAQSIKIREVEGKWGGDTIFNYQTVSKTYNVDVRTGIGLFWILNLVVGGGYSWNEGETYVSLSRNGPIVLQTAGISDLNIPREYQQFFNQDNSISQAGTLGLNADARGVSRRNIAYGIGGLDIDLFLLKINLEGIYGGKDFYGANLAVRISF
ncbi:Lsa36 family surface (lipo)protein [Leptospira sp. GIMC2001]|uniref:Lsa36 family surface (lipo)protein n=1 Tax=Leptospira sp. GIMC2001 TaxID=1513297 RepID=UPI0023496F4D|nr:hypothetical protein [Leptospira sp. GIMC2001]WCL47641.1 hypothetical protein O4O04_01350 [Leptospira sp. GIMC2001]